MTLHSAIRPADCGSAASDSAAAATPNVTPLRLAIWAILFQLAWNAKRLPDILREGWMPDADDFMRLHQIRNWLAGHGWFDASEPRMDPGTGGDLHWSRLVDVPIGFLIRFLELLASPVMAERMAAIVWPTMLLVSLVLIVAAICDRTAPQGNKLLTLLFTVMCVPAMAEFAPGVSIITACRSCCSLWHCSAWSTGTGAGAAT
jgi:hypothetical protein